MNTIQMYDAQADSIKIDDISSNNNNRIVLRRIKRNSLDDENNQDLYIQSQHDDDGEDCVDYVPEGAYDMGWLGYFIGKNEQLRRLFIRDFEPSSGASVTEVLEPFFMGLNYNKSITTLDFSSMDLLGGRVFTMLGPFFENCLTFTDLTVGYCHMGDDGWRLLALAIGSSKNRSLQKVSLNGCLISDEGSVEIITSLSMHPSLQSLWWTENRLGKNGCTALATLLRCSATRLKFLNLDNSGINDEGIEALVPALKGSSNLQTLYMNDNPSITPRGWQTFASILEASNSNHLTILSVQRNNIDDQAATLFANALVNNNTLAGIYLLESSITDVGWKSISKLLCDTSSVNSTFLSNHTLRHVINRPRGKNVASLKPLLTLNKLRGDKKDIATIKILQHHNNIDMMSFFEWEFKVLPLMIDWLERACSITMPENFEPNIGPRKLSSIYQFVRGMPLLYVETQLRRELEVIKSKELSLEEEQNQMRKKQLEMERKQLQLRHQQLVLEVELQQFEQRKQSVKEHKESLLEKLAR